jgi:hypothetical protein
MDHVQHHYGENPIGIKKSPLKGKEMAVLRQFFAVLFVLAILPSVTRHQTDKEGCRC